MERRLNPAPALLGTIDGINFDENGTNNGGFFSIPPDNHGAAGSAHVVSVVNRSIEWHRKSDGVQQNSQSHRNFFAPLSPNASSSIFDVKIVYDPYADRFVVVGLERWDQGANNPGNVSRILLAVSDDGDPNGSWYYQAIDAKEIMGGNDHWFDYPGLAVDEEAIYVTGNMFRFGVPGLSQGTRLFIVSRAGLYEGLGSPSVTRHDPFTEAGLGSYSSAQPAVMYDPGPAGMGTFLVSGWSFSGSNDSLSVIRVDDPLGSPTFTNSFVFLGDIGGSAVPDAPPAGHGIAD